MEARCLEQNKSKDVAFGLTQCLIVLQNFGFVLKEYNKEEKCGENSGIRLTITCPTCKMVAVLEKPPTECTCPSNEELDDAKFWTVTGTGPKEEQVNKSFNTLLPEIPNENQQKALTDIITNIVANNFGSTSSLSSKTTPTTSLWEIDPPIDKSSPLPSWNVKGHLQKAKSLLDEALNLLTDDDTYTKTSVKKRISDIKPTTPVQKGMNGDGRNPKGSTVKKGMIPVLNSVERKKVGIPTLRTPTTTPKSTVGKTKGVPKKAQTPLKPFK